MSNYLLLKWIHILSTILLFGTGLGSAFYKWMADRSDNIAHIAVTNRHVVLADWLFTTPTIIIQPISGLWMVYLLHLPISTPWIAASFILYAVAGLCWLPVVWLQIRMRDLATQALSANTPLPDLYHRYARTWFWLGVPAFISMIVIVVLMVFKPALEV